MMKMCDLSRRSLLPAIIMILAAGLLALLPVGNAEATCLNSATVTITSWDDSSIRGTLRWAIDNVCADGTIDFNISTYPATITLYQGYGPLSINKNLTITGPGADKLTISGGGNVGIFYITSGIVNISGLTISNGYPTNGYPNSGGGIFNYGTLTVTNSTFSGNWAAEGASLYNKRTLKVINSTFSGNHANYGGSIFNDSGGSLTVTNSTFSGNQATSDGAGGGIFNYGTLTVTNSTFSGNYAYNGGGISNNGSSTVTNSTFSGNSAIAGGGISNGGSDSGATLTVTNSTFRGNSAATGGGIHRYAGTVSVSNTIMADNTSGGNCSGTITDGGYNIDDKTTCGFLASSTSLSSTDPKLDSAGLQDNRGPTQTIALLAGSPAINAIPSGTNGCGTTVTEDQRGISRPQGGSCDIGAYEFVPVTTTTLSSSLNPSSYGDSVPFTATVNYSEPANTLSGTVTFKDGVTDITNCTLLPLTGNLAVCTPSTLTVGSHSITAEYSGDANFSGSTSSVLTQTVNKVSSSTTVSLTSGTNPSSFGDSLTFTATVTSTAGTPTGTVTFKDGATVIAACSAQSITGGKATCSTSSLAAGGHSVTAVYGGDANFTGSTSSLITQTVYPTTVTVAAATGNGDITLDASGSGCGFSSYGAVNSDDPGFVHPYGLVEFTLTCSQPDTQADVTVTYPGSIEKALYRKYGPTTPGDSSTTKWYTFRNVKVNSSNSLTLHLQDGQLGDDTAVDGKIVDQGGPGKLKPAVPVPAIDGWGAIAFIILAGLGSVYYLKRRRRAEG